MSPYSQMLENGDHTIGAGTTLGPVGVLGRAQRRRVDADQVGVHAARRAQVGVLAEQRRRRALGEVVDERRARRRVAARTSAASSTSALMTAWKMSCVVAVRGDLLLLDVADHPARERPRQRW